MVGIRGKAFSSGRHFVVLTTVLTAVVLMAAQPAAATVIDLTGGSGSGTINGAEFEFGNSKGGTGVLDPFVRIQASDTEEGYNTSNSSVPFDEKIGIWTHDMRLNEFPVIDAGGTDFLEFMLDINESGGGGALLSLDKIQIYTSPTGSQNTTVLASLGTLRYDLDAGGDSYILLDASNSSGSGDTDMTMLVPVSIFAGAAVTDFVYLYSSFGEQGTIDGNDFSSDDGFEEWAVDIRPDSVFIPEPAALSLIAMGAVALIQRRLRVRRWRRRARA